MAWDWAPTIGAFIGASIPAAVSALSLRTERRNRLQDMQRRDAETIAVVQQLLHDIDPRRRTINVNPAEGAEDAIWAELERRRDEVQRALLIMGTGHPYRQIRDLAQGLAVQIFNAATSSKWTVHDLLRDRDNPEYMDVAVRDHTAASETAAKLKHAIEATGSGRRWRRQIAS